jgi:hypothetical protein
MRPYRLARSRTSPFHGGNRGSNPLRDAILRQGFSWLALFSYQELKSMNLFSFFVTLQVIVLFLMTFHDWVHLPPFLDIRDLEKAHSVSQRLMSSIIFFFLIAIPLFLTWHYESSGSFWALFSIVNFYGWLTLGTILSWWVPYFLGSSEKNKTDFAVYKNTHHFLPARGDNVIPNTFHVIMHLLIWTCLVFSLILVWQYFTGSF